MENIQNHLVSLLFILSFETDFPTKGVKQGREDGYIKRVCGRRRQVIATKKKKEGRHGTTEAQFFFITPVPLTWNRGVKNGIQ